MYEADYTKSSSTIIAWSSDSSRIAFISDNSATVSLNIYNLETGETKTVIEKPSRDLIIALDWVNYDTELAFIMKVCDEVCQIYLEKYDAHSQQHIFSSEVLSFSQDRLLVPESLCQVRWSPDGRYMAFVHECYTFLYAGIKEVFLFDVVFSKTTQITNFTEDLVSMSDPPNPNLMGRFAYYGLFWLSDTQILIGAGYARERSINGVAETLIYDITTQTLRSIGDSFVLEASKSLMSNDFAIAVKNQDFDYIHVSILSTDNLENLTADKIYPPGCNLDWSPTNNRLAYSIPMESLSVRCVLYGQSIMFVDIETNHYTEFTPPNIRNYIVPVGWVRLYTH